MKISTASGVDGMLAPSETTKQPWSTSIWASSLLISFWVALGKATSHFTNQGRMPSKYSHLNLSAYSWIRPRRLFLRSMMKAHLSPWIPSLSRMVPLLSDKVMTLPPSWLTFSMVYWATLPEPDTAQILPFRLSPRVLSISSAK